MNKYLFVGDMHWRKTSPRARIDSYGDTFKNKVKQIFEYAKLNNVEAIIHCGDLLDSWKIEENSKMELADLLNESPVKIINILGNHDLPGHNIESYHRTSIRVIDALVPCMQILGENEYIDLPNVRIVGQPYRTELDINGYGYMTPNELISDKLLNIRLIHSSLMDEKIEFMTMTHVDDVISNVDLIIAGHIHHNFGPFKRGNLTLLNPGALMRSSASLKEIERKPQFVELSVDENKNFELKPILLECKPGEEVLDRSELEEAKKRKKAMNDFKATVKIEGREVKLEAEDIIRNYAKLKNVPEDIMLSAIEYLNETQSEIVSEG
jgi:DNA repair exonuclease SbcCD nuclease subunit